MTRIARLAALPFVCFFGSRDGIAEPAACRDTSVCVAELSSLLPQRPDPSLTDLRSEAASKPRRCPEAAVEVVAASADERDLICSAAMQAIGLLGRCGISLHRPLHVQIMQEVRHPLAGSIFGLLDIKREKVLITQEVNIPSLVQGTPYAILPKRDFYRSVIVHEVIHGIMQQNLKRPALSHSAYEYPAYALQIESLAPEVRDNFLQSFDQASIKTGAIIFSDPLLFMNPYFFAARAYYHFKSSGDGCGDLTALLSGEIAFIAPSKI